jgi:putative transposase
MKNHFHRLIRTHSEKQIRDSCPLKDRLSVDKILSLQFSHLFNSYAQAVNKSFKHTGGLFETPFRRISVNDESGLKRLVYYIHSNPLHHGFTDSFSAYPHSSYSAYLNNDSSMFDRDGGLAWFGNKEESTKHHEHPPELKRCQGLEP